MLPNLSDLTKEELINIIKFINKYNKILYNNNLTIEELKNKIYDVIEINADNKITIKTQPKNWIMEIMKN
jgi:hypothetical protein